MILFLIVYTAIRERKHAIWLAWAWLLGATIATVPAMLNPPTYEDDLHRPHLGHDRGPERAGRAAGRRDGVRGDPGA